MASTTKRRFKDKFKREAVALWETSGRPQTEIAAELGIVPTMLRRWQRKQQEGSAPPASPAAKPPVSAMASPADQALEIARLRRELDRARMERDILKKAVGIFAEMPRTYLSHTASFHSNERIAPSNRGIKQLGQTNGQKERSGRHQTRVICT
jgi:transposase